MNSSTGVPLCLLAAGVLSIVPAQSASADALPDQSRTVTTEDGWELTVTKAAENLDRVPNLADTAFTREGFVSLRAVADITGAGSASVNSGTLTMGYQIGCQIDVSNGISIGVAASVGPNVNVMVAPTPGLSVGVGAMAMPSVSTTFKPGTITTIPFGTKALAGPHGSITTDQVQIKIDACMGPVSLRSYVIANISTNTADNSVAVYGDPIWL
ncbi:MspA family porin [Nocardia sp. NPDC004278]